MVELKSRSSGFRESESSPKGHAPSFTTGINPSTESGCPPSGRVFGLDSPVQHPFGGLSSPFPPNRIVTTTALGTSTSSNPLSGPPVMPPGKMPAHNSSIARFGTPFSFPGSKSISGTTLSDAMFSTCRPVCSESAMSGGSSIFPHNDHSSQPPTFSFSTLNTINNFRPPSNSIAGCGALSEPGGFTTLTPVEPQKPTIMAQHSVSGFPNATSTCSNSQPTPFWNSPFKSSTEGVSEKISNSASPFESKQKSSCEGFAPFAATSNAFARSTTNQPSVSSSFITPFTQPSWFTPSAVKLAFHSMGGGSIFQLNAATHPPAFSFPNTTTTTTDAHFGPPRNSAPCSESTHLSTDSGYKKPSCGFRPSTPFGPLNMTGSHFPSTPSTQSNRPSKFPFESKGEGDGEKMRSTPTICSSCRQTEASTYALPPAPTECPHAKSTSVSATPDNKDKSPEELRWQCHESREKVGEQVDPVSEMALNDLHSIYPVMMMLPVIPALTHSFGAFPWSTIPGTRTGFHAPTLLGRNVPVLLVPSNLMGLNCFPTTVSGGNYFPSFNIRAMPAATDCLSEMFSRL